MFTIGECFAGVGGLGLGLEAAGVGRTIWQVEQDAWCRTILAKHWPDADRSVTDVEDEALFNLPRVDVLCGGPPCPDFSAAGKGKGITGSRGRLIFAYERAVRALRPRAVVLENVASGASKWLPHVRLFLASAGYRTRAIKVGACDVGSPQLRYRIFVLGLADADDSRCEWVGRSEPQLAEVGGCGAMADPDCEGKSRTEGPNEEGRGRSGDSGVPADPNGLDLRFGAERMPGRRESDVRGSEGAVAGHVGEARGRNAERGLGGDPAGLPRLVDRWPAGRGQAQFDWEPPRAVQKGVDPHRRARLKALGNCVVPHAAYVAGKALLEWIGETHETE